MPLRMRDSSQISALRHLATSRSADVCKQDCLIMGKAAARGASRKYARVKPVSSKCKHDSDAMAVVSVSVFQRVIL